MSLDDHCFTCHQAIYAGHFDEAPPKMLAEFQKHIVSLPAVPSLAGARRFQQSWIKKFLLQPQDLRPVLLGSMPRLALTDSTAAEIAAYLSPAPDEPSAPAPEAHLIERGRQLYRDTKCSTCHVFSGVDAAVAVASVPVPALAKVLAPDLRYARERMRPSALTAWLMNPGQFDPETYMPNYGFSRDDARALAAFVMGAPSAPIALKAMPTRLPILARTVTFGEVNRRVFYKTCRHCHADPKLMGGDGGPGSSGGFGFAPRHLSFWTLREILEGFVDEEGHRRSVFEPLSNGVPRLVAHLISRQAEEAGHIDPAVRGMPLGFPALTAEELQLVETWVAQGHRRGVAGKKALIESARATN